MSLLQQAKRLIHLYKFSPKKHLGQNFATDPSLLRRMISYASINTEDIVLEVGAGLGFLTQLLSKKCKRVVAVEVDSKLVKILKDQLRTLRNVDLIEGDVLHVDIPLFSKMVSTPPYSISSPILFWLLEKSFHCAVLTFQKEFAERLTAGVGNKEYGRLTVSTYYRAEVELLNHVSRDMFYPPPEVGSMVVRLKPRKPPFRVKDEKTFFDLLRTLFAQRNRKVRNAIIPFLRNRGIAEKDMMKQADSLLFHDRRVRQLTPEDFGALADEFA